MVSFWFVREESEREDWRLSAKGNRLEMSTYDMHRLLYKICEPTLGISRP